VGGGERVKGVKARSRALSCAHARGVLKERDALGDGPARARRDHACSNAVVATSWRPCVGAVGLGWVLAVAVAGDVVLVIETRDQLTA
jgi:hypothetical protein